MILGAVSGCEVFEEPQDEEPALSSGRVALLQSLGAEVYYPSYLSVSSSLVELERALSDWDGSREGASIDEARAAWRMSLLLWQRAELMQVGPAGVSGQRVGGEDRRDLIYAYPLQNPCRVDQELLAGRYREEGWGLSATINAKGLGALERLLYAADDENLCPESLAINQDGAWAEWAAEEGALPQARHELSLAIVADLKLHLDALVNAWAEGGEARLALSEGSAPFSNQREALDEVYASLYYADQVLRDLKLAVPLGLSMDCEVAPCLDDLELRSSGLSREAIIANLEGLLWVLCGGDPAQRANLSGFDDLLVEEGAPDLAEELISMIEALIGLLSEREEPLDELIESEPEWVDARYSELRQITALIKSQLATVLNLSVPREGAGDND